MVPPLTQANSHSPSTQHTGDTDTFPVEASFPPPWRSTPVLVAAAISVYSGYAQFSATATLPDVAAHFGQASESSLDLAAQIGLSGTTLGIGLALIRFASVFAQPLSRLADVHGRRRIFVLVTALGLAITTVAAGSWNFWVFVALFACARPMFSTANVVAGVVASEESSTRYRTTAMGFVAIGYGIGAGIPVVLRGVTSGTISFRVIFGLCLLWLISLPFAARWLREPERSQVLREPATRTVPDNEHTPASQQDSINLGSVPREHRLRLGMLMGISFAIAFLTGPANTFVLLYAESVANVSPETLAIVIPTAGILGGAGLGIGIKLSDWWGRKPTAIIAQLLMAIAGIVTYSGGPTAAVGGYIAAIIGGAMFAPALAALGAEIFPTAMRATAAGSATMAGTVGAVAGLAIFGLTFDLANSFLVAAIIMTLPVFVSTFLYLWLPETVGRELEDIHR